MKRAKTAAAIAAFIFSLFLVGASSDDCAGGPDGDRPWADPPWLSQCRAEVDELLVRQDSCLAAAAVSESGTAALGSCGKIKSRHRDAAECARECMAAKPDCDTFLYALDSCVCLAACGLPCAIQCDATEFACGDGKCLPPAVECDSFADCQDGSDEHALCQAQCADEGGFICDDGTCVNPEFECDYFADCPDGSDEHAGCTAACIADGGFVCTSGACIPAAWHCDGFFDCADHSDEQACP